MTFARWTAFLPLMLCLFTVRRAHATVIDTANFTETTWFAAGGTRTGMAWAPDGSNRLFVLDKGGTVDIVKWGAPPTMVTFATVTPIYASSECGLIGLTFDPNFQVNRYVYFFVTVSATEQQIIRYTASGDVGTDKTVIVSGLPTSGANHDGGAIRFGPDGKLYWGIGDLGNGTGVNADLTSLAAKIGRANRDGTVPNDNPFFDGSGTNNDYVWARGFRNPFTLTFQPTIGALWVNVVGTLWEQIFVVGKGDHAGYSAYENNQPAGFLGPIIRYRTNGTDFNNLAAAAGAVRSSGVVTFTTLGAHSFRQGERVDITGVTDTSFNGSVFVATVTSSTTFTALQPGPDATSGGGTATTLNQGGCVTGGSFYDGTQFGAAYRGNFFYGDYNSGRLMRAVIAAGTTVTSVDYWGTDVTSATDTAIGPDGALYYMGIGGTIYRTTFNTGTQSIVVSSTHVWMAESGQSSVNVSLAIAPPANVTVNAARIAGDTDVTVSAGAVLTFTPGNWNVPQPLTFAAAVDLDVARDTATIEVSSSGLAPESIVVNVIDEDANNFFVSRASLPIVEGGSGTFTVALAAAPQAALTVTVARATGDTDISVASGASLAFDSTNFSIPQTVTIAAAEDADVTNDTADISVTGAGMTTRSVSVTASDNDPVAPLITSTPPAKAVVNAPYRYDVVATGFPAPTFSLASSPVGMTIDTTAGSLRWTPSQQGVFSASVVAANGVAPNATQAFTIDVGPDAAPTCALTRPTQGERVSGRTAEFYGDGFDDVGTTDADFFIDGVRYTTDSNTAGHYHFGGEHNRWDTTLLADGPHKVKMSISDTIGQMCSVAVDVTVANLGDGGAPDAGDSAVDAGDGAADARDSAVDAVGDRGDGAGDAGTDGQSGVDVVSDAARDAGSAADAAGSTGDGAPDGSLLDATADGGDGSAVEPSESVGGGGCGCKVGRSGGTPQAWIGLGALFLVGATRRSGRRHGVAKNARR